MYYRSLTVRLESSSFVGGWLKVGRLMFEPLNDTVTATFSVRQNRVLC